MDKRTFLKESSVIAGGALLSHLISCTPKGGGEHLKNWAGNLTYSTGNVHYPASIEQMQELVKKSKKIKALGSRHSFNKIADSKDNQLSTRDLNKLIAIDTANSAVTVESGMKYGELAPLLQEKGFALHNLASLPHISIGGAVATATHGSGIRNGNLSTAVTGIEFINAAGDIVHLSKFKDGDMFDAAIVSLGAIGIVTRLTLDLQPTFNVRQIVYRNLSMNELQNNFQAIMAAGYSVSFFTDWRNRNISEVWVKQKVNDGDPEPPLELFGAKQADKNLHPIETESAENCTDQMGVPGPWYDRLPHFKMGFKPSAGKELQSEYFVPVEKAVEAMMAMEKLNEKIAPHLFISEIRTIAADNFWMSPCFRRPCVALHTTWKQEPEAVMALLPLIEQALAPFNPRPHWAKLFTLPPAVLQSRYEKLNDFKSFVDQNDPGGKFRNEFLEKNLYQS
jgi:xylitol oxidase